MAVPPTQQYRARLLPRGSVTLPDRPARLALLGSCLILLGGCSSAAAGSAAGSAASGASSVNPAPVAAVSTPSEPVVRVDGSGSASSVSYHTPVKLVVEHGSFASVQVSAVAGGEQMGGGISADGTSWQSQEPPKPAVSYTVTAMVKGESGPARPQSVEFTAAAVPEAQRVAFTVTPQGGSTVGIGQPIVVRFLTPIAERAAMEKVMLVQARTPSGQAVTGSWRWLSSREVHWRPRTFWAPGTRVTLDLRIAGVKAAPNRYGRKDYHETFTIGASHVTRYDAASHRLRVFRDGKLVGDWPSGSGRSGLETYSGTYVVLGKAPVVQMNSCSARITCDKKDPDYYDEKEFWATRLTSSGTFIHAADWDSMMGKANVSHGCIHLPGSDAKSFYDHAVPGDVVIVTRTGRGPQPRVNTQDPGLYDWNLSWSVWRAGSALR
jgi:lipoprotein-anchoring transpeptidase ErfK/SrfK